VRVSRAVREGLLAMLAGCLLALFMRRPGPLATTVPGDLGDPLLLTWILAWGGHAVSTAPAGLWDGNVFAPLHNTLAFSDSLLGYLPFGLVGSGPDAALVRYNIVFLVAYALAFGAVYLLVRQLGLGRGPALVAGLAYAFNPWRISQTGHLQVLSSGGIPLALAMLARGHGLGRRHPGTGPAARGRPGWAVAGWAVATWQVSLGFGLGLQLAYLLGVVALVVLWTWRRDRPSRGLLLADAAGLLLFVVVGVALALPYAQAVRDHPQARRDAATVALFSPTPAGFVTAPPQSRLWGTQSAGRLAAQSAPAEDAMAPGLLVTVLAALGLAPGPWSRRRRLVLAGGVLVLCVLALGTNGPYGGRFSYLPLLEHAPGWQGVRTPSRLVTTAWLFLALLAAHGVAVLRRAAAWDGEPGAAGLRTMATGLVALVLLLEGADTHAHPAPRPAPVALGDLPAPLLVLPSDDSRDTTVMWWSTDRFPPVVNGVSGFVPAELTRLRAAADSLPAPDGLAALRAAGVRTLVLLPGSTTRLPAGLPAREEGGATVVDLRSG